MKIVMLGKPGAGKGTISKILSKDLNLPHISSGDLFRNLDENSEIGKEVKSYMDNGNLVPDELVIKLVEERLSKDDVKEDLILDGFPRTVAQAEELDRFMEANGSKIDISINIDISDEKLMSRLQDRLICSDTTCGTTYNLTMMPPKVEGKCDKCGADLKRRDDDNPEVIKNRLDQYAKSTGKLVDYYDNQNKLYNVLVNKESPELAIDIEKYLKEEF